MKSSPGWFPSCPLPLYQRCSPNSTRKQHRGEHRAAELCPTLLQPPDPPGCLQLSCPTSATGGAQVMLNHCSAGGSRRNFGYFSAAFRTVGSQQSRARGNTVGTTGEQGKAQLPHPHPTAPLPPPRCRTASLTHRPHTTFTPAVLSVLFSHTSDTMQLQRSSPSQQRLWDAQSYTPLLLCPSAHTAPALPQSPDRSTANKEPRNGNMGSTWRWEWEKHSRMGVGKLTLPSVLRGNSIPKHFQLPILLTAYLVPGQPRSQVSPKSCPGQLRVLLKSAS